MNPLRLHNGALRVQSRMEAPGVIGDGTQDIDPGHPHYEAWDKWLTQNGAGPDEVFRYGVDDPDEDLPPGIIAHHDNKDYPGGIVTYRTRILPVKAQQLSLVPIYPDHHESTAVQEISERLGGVDEFLKVWNDLSAIDQNALLRQIGDNTGESIWTLKHEIQKLGG